MFQSTDNPKHLLPPLSAFCGWYTKNSPWYCCKALKTSAVTCDCKYVKICDTNRPEACSIVCETAWNSINVVRCKTRAGSSEDVSCSSRAWRCPNSCGLKQNKITVRGGKKSAQIQRTYFSRGLYKTASTWRSLSTNIFAKLTKINRYH